MLDTVVRRPMRWAWAGLGCFALACGAPEPQVADLQRVADATAGVTASSAAPGLSLAIAVGDVTYSAGYGVRDLSTGAPMTADTRFAIGSTSKAFTGFALAMLHEQGVIDARAPVSSTWPELVLPDPDATLGATPFDLLSHITGTPSHHLAWYSQQMSRADLVDRVAHLPDDPTLPYGASFSYNNENYAVAGALIERATGQTWEDWTQTQMLDVIGMANSSPRLSDMTASVNWARGYNAGYEIPVRPVWQSAGPAGTIVSTATDMARWLQTLVAGGQAPNGTALLADASVLHEAHNANTPFGHYGLGWAVLRTDGGCTVVLHGGHLDGYSAYVSYVPELSIGVATLVNHHRDPLSEEVHADIYASLLGQSGACPQIPEVILTFASAPPPPPVFPPAVQGQRLLHLNHPGYGDLYLTATATEYQVEYGDTFMPVRAAPDGSLYLENVAHSLTITYPSLAVLEEPPGTFAGLRIEFSSAPVDFLLATP